MGYQVGQQVRLSGVFTNAAGERKDPTTVALKVQNAEGEETTVASGEIVRDSEGAYHHDVTITKPASGNGGTWYYRWEGTGALIAAGEGHFAVEQTQF